MRVLGGVKSVVAGFAVLVAGTAQAQVMAGEPAPTVPKFVVLGGRVARLSEADTTLFELAYVGKNEEACNHFAAHWKDLESCIGLRALQGEPRRELLAGLAKRGHVDYRRKWDRMEILMVDPLGHFAGLLPDLKLEEIEDAPADQIIALFQHPDFPKAWLKEEDCAWMALRALKAHNENRDALRDILQSGVPAKNILMTQAQSHESLSAILLKESRIPRTVRYLLEGGQLKLQDPTERKVVLDIALQADDPDLWHTITQRQLKWAPEFDAEGRQLNSWPEELKDFSGWLSLKRHLGTNLHQSGLYRWIFYCKVEEKDVQEARQFLKEAHLPAEEALIFAILRDSHASWLPLLTGGGLNPNVRGPDGGTLLHAARGSDRLKALLDAGADPRARNPQGDTCLFARNRWVDELDLLIKAGAPADASNHLGENALFYQSDADSLARLMQAGADPRQVSQKGETLWSRLDFESGGRMGPKLEAIDGAGLEEPLARHVDLLLKQSGTAELADRRGLRPLMLTAGMGRPLLLWKLLGAGADPQAVDPDGRNALDRILLQSKGDAWKLGPDGFGADADEHAVARMAVCIWLLKESGLKPHVPAGAPGVDGELWELWLRLKEERSLPDEFLTTALSYDEPAFSRKWITTTPEGLGRLIDACAWRSASDCLDAQVGFAQQDPQAIRKYLKIMQEKQGCRFNGSCAINSGRRQASFDAFLAKLEALARK